MSYFCKVIIDESNGKKCLKKLAEIYSDSLKMARNEEKPIYSSIEISQEAGVYGVWSVDITPAGTIEAKYQADVMPIEICEVEAADDLDSLKRMLFKDGADISPIGNQTLFCPKAKNNQYHGIFINEEEAGLKFSGCRFLMNDESKPTLPHYDIAFKDTMEIDNKRFYGKLSFSSASVSKYFLIKEPFEIVCDAFNEWLKTVPQVENRNTELILAEIDKASRNNSLSNIISRKTNIKQKAEISNLIKAFQGRIKEYFELHKDEPELIKNVFQQSQYLQEEIAEQWRSANRNEIEAGKKELEALSAAIDNAKDELNRLTAQAESANKETENQPVLQNGLQYRFPAGIGEALPEAVSSHSREPFIILDENSEKICDDGKYKNVTELVEKIAYNLEYAGVFKDYRNPFAAFLYACYINKRPVLLTGPNGKAIADAFSSAVCGKEAGELDCSAVYNRSVKLEIKTCSSNVIALNNFFTNGWINRISDFTVFDKQFFILHPFTEDLLIEPKSLFYYVFPVFTSFIVDPVYEIEPLYSGCKEHKEFEKYDGNPEIDLSDLDSRLCKLGIIRSVRRRIEKLFKDFRDIYLSSFESENDNDELYDFIFAVLPYAYIFSQQKADVVNSICEEMTIYDADKIDCIKDEIRLLFNLDNNNTDSNDE